MITAATGTVSRTIVDLGAYSELAKLLCVSLAVLYGHSRRGFNGCRSLVLAPLSSSLPSHFPSIFRRAHHSPLSVPILSAGHSIVAMAIPESILKKRRTQEALLATKLAEKAAAKKVGRERCRLRHHDRGRGKSTRGNM